MSSFSEPVCICYLYTHTHTHTHTCAPAHVWRACLHAYVRFFVSITRCHSNSFVVYIVKPVWIWAIMPHLNVCICLSVFLVCLSVCLSCLSVSHFPLCYILTVAFYCSLLSVYRAATNSCQLACENSNKTGQYYCTLFVLSDSVLLSDRYGKMLTLQSNWCHKPRQAWHISS